MACLLHSSAHFFPHKEKDEVHRIDDNEHWEIYPSPHLHQREIFLVFRELGVLRLASELRIFGTRE